MIPLNPHWCDTCDSSLTHETHRNMSLLNHLLVPYSPPAPQWYCHLLLTSACIVLLPDGGQLCSPGEDAHCPDGGESLHHLHKVSVEWRQRTCVQTPQVTARVSGQQNIIHQ